MPRPRIFVLVLCVMLSAAMRVAAQGVATVPLSDPVYDDLDRLHDLGLLDTMLVGQRPYSWREVGRATGRAHLRIAAASATGEGSVGAHTLAEAEEIVRRLDVREALYESPSPVGARLTEASLYAVATDARARAFPSSFSAPLEAEVLPLASRRLGSVERRGFTAGVELGTSVEPVGWLAIAARGRVEGVTGASSASARGELLLANARARYRNTVLTVGREQLGWSTAPDAGLFLNAAAPALDLLSLASDQPFRLPWVLGRAGPARATIVLADLGASVTRSHSEMLAYKVSVQPGADVEIGGTFVDHFGGEGGRTASLTDRVIDFLPFLDVFRTHNYTDSSRTLDVESDKLLGIDGRIHLRRLAGMVVSGELLIDDLDIHRLPTLLTWDGSQSVNVLVPRLGGTGLALRAAAKHLGVRTYTHAVYGSGLATHGRLLGEPLGPDAKSFAAGLDWIREPGVRVSLDARSAIFTKSDYVTVQNGVNFVIHRIGPAVNELEDSITGALSVRPDPGMVLSLRAGIARVRNAGFVSGQRYAHAIELSARLLH